MMYVCAKSLLILVALQAVLTIASDVNEIDHFNDAHHVREEGRAVTAAGTEGSDAGKSDKVYLRSITALVFSENGRATSRNGPRKQQLRCVGGSASGFWWFSDYYPHVVQCRNIGWDGASIQWSCEGNLHEFVEFGPDTQVKCEPYDDDPNDGYVLRGSCRLEYTLNFSTFHISFVHVVYGCVLTIGLLWFYYQSRYLIHRYLKNRAARIAAKKTDTAKL